MLMPIFTAAMRHVKPALLLLAALLVFSLAAGRPVQAGPTSLTYTGQLLTSLSPPTAANGSYDMQFKLFTAATGGSQAGPTVSVASVPVVGGVYYVQLNFGTVFSGTTYWLEASYRPVGTSGAYTAVTPRPIAPNSAFADYATLSGSTQGLQSKPVSAAFPTAGQALVYDGRLWSPTTLPSAATYTAGAGLALSGTTFSIPSGGVTGPMLGTGSVTPSAIALPLYLSGAANGPLVQISNTGSAGYGLYASSMTPGSATIRADGTSGAIGVNANSDTSYGVSGTSTSSSGVSGYSASGVGGSFQSLSGYGLTASGGPVGVSGYATTLGGQGVSGNATGGSSSGVSGVSDSGSGVSGSSTTGAGGYFTSAGGYGLYGETTAIGGNGITGIANVGSSAYGIYGISTSGYAGVFAGKVSISGNLYVGGSITAGTKDFKIDDPLDPSGKYLTHACIESDQMADLYSGNVTLGSDGSAWVLLPDWFQALNKDFRYQLTSIGGFAPVYVAQKVTENRFQIAGGKPGMEVSWQVTGVRQDAYAVAHPLQAEEDKPADERGLYLHPDAFGLPADQGIGYAQRQAHAARGPRQP